MPLDTTVLRSTPRWLPLAVVDGCHRVVVAENPPLPPPCVALVLLQVISHFPFFSWSSQMLGLLGFKVMAMVSLFQLVEISYGGEKDDLVP